MYQDHVARIQKAHNRGALDAYSEHLAKHKKQDAELRVLHPTKGYRKISPLRLAIEAIHADTPNQWSKIAAHITGGRIEAKNAFKWGNKYVPHQGKREKARRLAQA